jgi:hypothetical protein
MSTTHSNGAIKIASAIAAQNAPRVAVSTVWWLNPAALFLCVAGGTLLMACAQSKQSFEMYNTPKYLGGPSLGLGLLACLMVACGVYLGASIGAEPRPLTAKVRRSLAPWFYLASGLTLLGYAIWFGNGLRNGFSLARLLEMVRGADEGLADEMKFEVFRTIPGITTFTQFGLLAVLLGALLHARDGRRVKTLLGSIVVLSGIRMVLVSERLALVEVLVLIAIVWLRTSVLDRRLTLAGHFRLAVAPVAGVFVLAALMGGTEYVRSWKHYRNEYPSIISFTTARLNSYYATSHNNGAMAWSLGYPFPLPYYVLEWFWRFPLLNATPLSYENMSGIDRDEAHEEMLARYGTRELNNPGGLFCPTLDLGIVGGALFWLTFGVIAGRLYRGYLARALWGVLLYPVIVLSILEVPRHLYMCSVRLFPSLCLSLVLIYVVSRRQAVTGHAD